MNKLKLLSLFVVLVLFSCHASTKNNNKQPNIIIIYADDLGRGMLSTYGQKIFTTPNIDKLADGGMKFYNSYGCQFCAPARASLLTGMHDCHPAKENYTLTRAGIYEQEAKDIDLKEISKAIHKVAPPAKEGEYFLGTVAQKAGYNTATFGKLEWGFATTPERLKSHGWDYHYGYYDHRRCHGFYPPFLFENGKLVEIPGNTHIDCAKTNNAETPEAYKKRWDMTGKAVYSEHILVDKMLGFMEDNNPAKTDKPFFIYFPSQLPHGPIAVPAVDPELKDKPGLTEFEKEYATMVKILDNSVGRIYAKCEELGILDNTIIVFTGDNGHEVYTVEEGRTANSKSKLDGSKYDNVTNKFYSNVGNDVFNGNDGMAGLKRDNWEGGVRVPLIWYWKDNIKAGKSTQLVNNYDILNTVAELIGTKQRTEKDSYSYAQTLLKGKGKSKEYTVFSSQLGAAIVNKDGWKLRYMEKNDIFQLYNIKDDYKEEHVLNQQYPERVEELKAILIKECDGDLVNGGRTTFENPMLKK